MAVEGRPGQDSIREIVAEIYEAAVERDTFVRLGGLIAQATESVNGVVVMRNGLVPVALSATTPPKAAEDYLTYYGRIDPWAKMTLGRPGEVTTSQDLISDEALLKSEFYVDYARHLGMFHPMGTTRLVTPDIKVTLGVNRPHDAPHYSESDKSLITELARHIQRALQLRLRLDTLQARADAGFAVLDRLSFGVVVADAEGRVVFANAPAETLHREGAGIILSGGRLGAPVVSEALRLAQLVRDAAKGGSGGAMRLTDRVGSLSLLLLVAPLPARLGDSLQGRGLALVALKSTRDSPAFAEAVLAQLYGLSRAEAQVVLALAGGRSLEEISHERGVKISTLKTQILVVFRKTGAESQRDLLRLIGMLPQVR